MATSPDVADLVADGGRTGRAAFEVSVAGFTGPFELLLALIAKRRLDVTEIALAEVTDEFVAHLRASSFDLSVASEFLVIAATLLDLKAARLLPRGEVEDEEDLALLEARDLLFARLLQYRAFKLAAHDLAARAGRESTTHPRAVPLEPHFAALLPELVVRVGADRLAELAAGALSRAARGSRVDLGHLHSPRATVREQAAVLVARLRRADRATFRALVADAEGTAVVVVRFLALLELFKAGVVAFEQVAPLADLTVRWVGAAEGEVALEGLPDEPDADDGAPPPSPEPSAAVRG